MDIPLPLPVLLDGATGTELQKRGMPQGACTEHWILNHPDVLAGLQREYMAAGSQILIAPTFGANPAALEKFGLGSQTAEYNRRLVALTRSVAGQACLVAGDMASCELTLAPVGEARFEDMVENYRIQASALRAAGVDLYLIETMVTMAEARAAVLAVGESDPGKPILVSFYCDGGGRTPDGTDVLAALIVMQGMGVSAFGINCALAEEIGAQLERLAPYTSVPLLAMPCGGESTPAEFAAWAEEYGVQGVRCFGGCCQAGPEKIAALKKAVDALHLAPFAPREQDPDVIPCAGGREARFITPDVDVGEMIACSPNLLEEILETEEQRPQGALKIGILEEDDLDFFAEHQYAIRDALCLWSDVPELLERALREYQGRAFWDGTAELEPTFLRAMSQKYGLVLL